MAFSNHLTPFHESRATVFFPAHPVLWSELHDIVDISALSLPLVVSLFRPHPHDPLTRVSAYLYHYVAPALVSVAVRRVAMCI